MHPIAALMLARSIEEERLRAAQHRRRWLDDEPLTAPHRRGGRFSIPRLARFLRLANSAG